MSGVLQSRLRARASATRVFLIASALAVVACERDMTGPERGLVLVTRMPSAMESLSPAIAAQVAPFDKIRLTLTRVTGATAVDETFSVGTADPIEVDLQVPLSLNVPLLGELMTLVVTCIDPSGTVVYRGGPVAVLIKPGAATAPVNVQLAYVGNGSLAATLEIVPNALSVLLGQVFSFTATARDAQGVEIPGAPVIWSVRDPLLATLTSPLGGVGTALGLPGTARIIAQVPDGPADTALLTIEPLAEVERLLQLVSGGGQSGLIGALLGDPIVVRVVDGAAQPLSGIPVVFSATNGGLLGTPNVLSNATGLAQTTWTLGSLLGTQTLTATAQGLTGPPLTVPASGLPIAQPVATALQITTTLTSRVAGTLLSPNFVVRAVDASGNVVPGFANPIAVALGSNPGGATLLGTRTVTPTNGVATFDDLSLQQAASGYTLVATASGLTSATSNAFSITNAAASVMSIVSGNNQSALLGVLLGSPLSVRVTDAFANPVAGVPVAWAVTLGGGLLGNGTTQTNAGGIATNTWTLGLLAGLQRATASVNGLTGSPSTFTATGLLPIEPVATALEIPTTLTSRVAGTLLPTFVVRAVDESGDVVPNYTNAISVALGSNPGGATLLGTRTVTPSNGIATFDDLSLQKAASGYTLVATATGLTGATSNAFTISNAAASAMSIVSGDDQSALVGTLLGNPLSVRVTDAFANPVAGFPVNWAVTQGGGLLGNATTQTNGGGIATNTWTLGLLAGLQRVSASGTGLGSPVIFDATGLPIAQPIATALQITTSVATTVAGVVLSTNFVVRAVDAAGNLAPGFTSPITVALGSNPGGATLLGTRTATPTNGVAVFDDLSLQNAASGYTLVATATGLASATSNSFTITNAAAAVMSLVSGTNQSALIGTLLANPLSVRVTDAFANPVAGVPVAWAATLGGGALGTPTTQTNGGGFATNTWTLGLLAGLQRATASVTGLSGSPSTFAATGLPLPAPVATALEMVTTLSSSVAGTSLTNLVVRAVDAAGDVVTSYVNPITVALGSNPGGATLLGTRTVTPTNGVATFNNLSLQQAASGYTLVATASGLTGATSNAFSITNAAASVVSIVSGDNQSALVGALLGSPLSVKVTDAFSNPVAGFPVNWAVTLGGGALGNSTTQTNGGGVATNTWTLGLLAGVQRVTATGNGLASPAIFDATGLPIAQPVATALQMATSVTTTVAGVVLSTNFVVRAVDAAGNVVPNFANPITVALGQNPGGATLLGTRTVTPTNGVATFDDLSLQRAASGYTLVATATGLTSATSNAFSITNAAAAILETVSGNNQSALVGTLLGSPLSVHVTDAFGNAVAGTLVAWAATLGGGALGTPTTQTNGGGIATNTWTLGLLAGLQRATASVSGLSGSPSTFTATGLPLPAPVATALEMVTTLSSSVAGTSLTSLVVRAVDEAGDVVPTYTNAITVALGSNPGGATLLGTRTVTPTNGVATFNNLSLQQAASGYTLVATASGLTGATSNAFSITNAAAAVMSLVSGNNQSALVGALLGSPLSVRVTDAFGNPVAGTPVAWAATLGGGSLGNPTTQTNATGTATNTWTLGLLAGLQRATASVTGLSGSPSTFTATGLPLPDPVATALQMPTTLSSAVAGTPLSTNFVVRAVDASGNAVPSFTNPITVALGNNPGGATLLGTSTVTPSNGIATFDDLALQKVGSGYTLVATATGLTSVTSNAFSVTNAAAAVMSIVSGNNQSAIIGALLGSPLSVRVVDAFGNPVAGVPVAWAVSLGGGLLGNATTQTNASGIATNTWSLGLLAGLQRVTASVNGLSRSPATFTATGLLGLSPGRSR